MITYREKGLFLHLWLEKGQTIGLPGKMTYANLRVKMHGGFVLRRKIGRRNPVWTACPPWYGTIKNPEVIRDFVKHGAIVSLSKLNDTEFKRLRLWRVNLYDDLANNKKIGTVADELSSQIRRVDRWLGAFAKWYTTYKLKLPRIQLAKQPPLFTASAPKQTATGMPKAINYGKGVNMIRVAPLKYLARHFEEVDKYIRKGYKQTAALDEVARKYEFNREGFEKQYRNRWLNRKRSIRS
jgi:hypothetical protein